MVVFGMGDWVLTQGSLLRRDDKVWVVALEWGIGYLRRGSFFVGMTILGVVVFGMGDLFLTQGALLRRDDNFGWVVGLEWVICFLRRGRSFVGMTILGGWRAY